MDAAKRSWARAVMSTMSSNVGDAQSKAGVPVKQRPRVHFGTI
jgi:hypothetical protein